MPMDLIRDRERVNQVWILAPLDHFLEWVGLPRIEPLIQAVSPKNIISDKIGLPTPNDLAEAALERFNSTIQLPRPRRLL